MNIFIGDKVRLLHDRESGIVVKEIDEETVAVAIEAGFEIPVLKKELVKIDRAEAHFEEEKAVAQSSKTTKAPEKAKLFSSKGFYLVIKPLPSSLLDFYLLNNSDVDILFGFYSKSSRDIQLGELKGLEAGRLRAKQLGKIHQEKLNEISDWNTFVFEAIFFSRSHHIHHQPLIKTIRFTKKDFDKPKVEIAKLDSKCFLFQLDEKIEKLEIDAEVLKNSMLERNEPEAPKIIQKPSNLTPIIDLHLENLEPKFEELNLDKAQILDLQLKHFKKKLDIAILQNIEKITFIHGVGNGTLKYEIQKTLSQHPQIDTFKDAMKERFGYGATEVFLK